MLEVMNNCLIIDGSMKPLKSIHVVKGTKNNIGFMDVRNHSFEKFDHTLEELQDAFTKAGVDCFVRVENSIINTDRIKSVRVEQSDEDSEDIYWVTKLEFANSRYVNMYASSKEEAENILEQINGKLQSKKNNCSL